MIISDWSDRPAFAFKSVVLLHKRLITKSNPDDTHNENTCLHQEDW